MPTVAPLDARRPCRMGGRSFLGDVPFFALADGTIHRLDGGHKARRGAMTGLLCAVLDPPMRRLITGGEDGKVAATAADGTTETFGRATRKWITSVAAGPQGAVAFASGQRARASSPTARSRIPPTSAPSKAWPSRPRACASALARYNGVTLHFRPPTAKPVDLRMEGRAHRGHLLARRQFPRHHHAGERPARLEARRRQATCA